MAPLARWRNTAHLWPATVSCRRTALVAATGVGMTSQAHGRGWKYEARQLVGAWHRNLRHLLPDAVAESGRSRIFLDVGVWSRSQKPNQRNPGCQLERAACEQCIAGRSLRIDPFCVLRNTSIGICRRRKRKGGDCPRGCAHSRQRLIPCPCLLALAQSKAVCSVQPFCVVGRLIRIADSNLPTPRGRNISDAPGR